MMLNILPYINRNWEESLSSATIHKHRVTVT